MNEQRLSREFAQGESPILCPWQTRPWLLLSRPNKVSFREATAGKLVRKSAILNNVGMNEIFVNNIAQY